MRKSYDGLQALARHEMSRDPLDGSLYNKIRGTQCRAYELRDEEYLRLKVLTGMLPAF